MPAGIKNPASNPDELTAYAQAFLRGVINAGVQVLGLTPHRQRLGDSGDLSATWKIIEEWNSGSAKDGIPFREHIFAVFPGFEPSLNHGKNGLHLIFLFDPEIGKQRYLEIFDLIMEGIPLWKANALQMPKKRPEEVIELLADYQAQHSGTSAAHSSKDCSSNSWNYLVLAPHIDSN